MRSPQAKQPRVLVVDPNRMSRQLTAKYLQSAGYDVVQAATGERGLIILREWSRRVDWLYTAVNLPGLVDGWILEDEYHQTHPSRPVIYAGSKALERRAKPNENFLAGPASPKAVLATLRQAETSTFALQDNERGLGIAA